MPSSFWKDAASVIPFIGPVAAGAIERGQNRRAIERQNEYNKPINQLARLREAGLPFAAMTDAISGNQSNAQQSNSSGIQEGISAYATTTVQRKQLQLLDAQIDATRMQAKKTEAEAQGIFNRNQIDQLDPLEGEPVSYLARKAKIEILTGEAEQILRENQSEIARLDKQIKNDLYRDGTITNTARQQLHNMVQDWWLKHQQYVTVEMKTSIERKLLESLQEDGLSVGEAFIHAITTGALGTGQIIRQ